MKNQRISKSDKKTLQKLFKKYVVQSADHAEKITELYGLIREACRNEFTEETGSSLDIFLKERFEASIDDSEIPGTKDSKDKKMPI